MTSDRDRVSFGLKTSQSNLTYTDILRTWREADQVLLFEHAWLWDHMIPLRGDMSGAALEAWTLLAALAAQTERLRVGIMVTSNRLRPPAVLAKMAATVDIIAGGRLIFGIGAGGSAVSDPAGTAMVHRELDAYGIDVVPAREAVVALSEACTIARRLWDEEQPFDFEGRCYHLTAAICEPKPLQRPHPPILIGAGGERFALRVVAEHADIWNCPTRGDVAEFRHKSEVLDDHCAAIGRDPAEIVRSVQILIAPAEPPQPGAESPNRPSIVGPSAARELLLAFIAAGARHLVLAAIPPYPLVQWLAEEIIEPVIAAIDEAQRPVQRAT